MSHSDDSGSTWSHPVQVAPSADANAFPATTVTVAPTGDVYVSWSDVSRQVVLARSTDGGVTFEAPVVVDEASGLPGTAEVGHAIPAQPLRGVGINQTVTASSSRVFVVYAAPGADGIEQDVRAVVLDRKLERLHPPVQVNPPDGTIVSDQFEPVSALDPRTGALWACFYDSRGDRSRRSVRFACTASLDGIHHWREPLPVASVRSNTARWGFGYGDYQGLAIGSDGVAHPTWTDARNGAQIYSTTLTLDDLKR